MAGEQKDPIPQWAKPYIERLWAYIFSSTGSKIAWATVIVGLGQIASPWWLPILEGAVRTRLPNVSLVANPAIGLTLVLAAFVYHLAYLFIDNLKGKVAQKSEVERQQDREMFVNAYMSRRDDLRYALQWTGNWLGEVQRTLEFEQPEQFSTSYVVDRRRFGFEEYERVHDLRFFASVDSLRTALNDLVKVVLDYNETAWILSRHATFVILTRGITEALNNDDNPEEMERRRESAKDNADRLRRYSERYAGCDTVGDIIKHPTFIADVEAAKARVAKALPSVVEALDKAEAEVRRLERQYQKVIEQAEK